MGARGEPRRPEVEDRLSGDSMNEQMHNGQTDGPPADAGPVAHGQGHGREKRRLMLTQILHSPVLNPAVS